MKGIAVVGTGYVGLTTGACFAELGTGLVCVDIGAAKFAQLWTRTPMALCDATAGRRNDRCRGVESYVGRTFSRARTKQVSRKVNS